MKTIPFDIEKWKAGAVPVTKEGSSVSGLRDMTADGCIEKLRLVGVVDGNIETWTLKGYFTSSEGIPEWPSNLCLLAPEPERRTIYLYTSKVSGKQYVEDNLGFQSGFDVQPLTQELRDGKWVVVPTPEVES